MTQLNINKNAKWRKHATKARNKVAGGRGQDEVKGKQV